MLRWWLLNPSSSALRIADDAKMVSRIVLLRHRVLSEGSTTRVSDTSDFRSTSLLVLSNLTFKKRSNFD